MTKEKRKNINRRTRRKGTAIGSNRRTAKEAETKKGGNLESWVAKQI